MQGIEYLIKSLASVCGSLTSTKIGFFGLGCMSSLRARRYLIIVLVQLPSPIAYCSDCVSVSSDGKNAHCPLALLLDESQHFPIQYEALKTTLDILSLVE